MKTYHNHLCTTRLFQKTVPPWFFGLLYTAKVAHDTSQDLTKEVSIDLQLIGNWADEHFSLDGVGKLGKGKIFVQFAKNWVSNLEAELNLEDKIDMLDLAIAMGSYRTRGVVKYDAGEILDIFQREYGFASDLLDNICHPPENLNSAITIRPDDQPLRVYLANNDVECSANDKSWFGKAYAAKASEISRGPIFQPLYQRMGIKSVLLISDISLSEEYGIGKGICFKRHDNKVSLHDGPKPINKIFYGPPGTGKTYHIQDKIIEKYQSAKDFLTQTKSLPSAQYADTINHFEFVTFHQAFSYEDFVEGIKPVMDEDNEGELEYRIEPGVFQRICEEARRNGDQQYAIFIDEINRGNVASIFGELITLIEPDKREGQENELSVTLPYSKKKFSVPSNLDIYGTMNTADRSVEALDTALRRRFEFEEIGPNWRAFDEKVISGINVGDLMRTINQRIEHLLDKDHCIGHSYFYQVTDFPALQQVFAKNILPLLQEYFYGDFGKVGLILGDAFVKARNERKTSFASFDHPDSDLLQEKLVYDLQKPTDIEAESYRAIYS